MLSIIIPCFNEGEKLVNNIEKIINSIKYLEKYEIICVNDGSTDNTKEFMKKKIPNVKFVGYKHNKGKGYAIKKGIEIAKGDYILFMDADLSTNLEAIKDAITYCDKYDMIIGSRTMKESKTSDKTIIRNLSSYVSNAIIRIMFNFTYKDTQCGFKMMNKKLAKEIISKQKINRWSFDVEYLYIASLNHYSVKEIPVEWHNDSDSRVKLFTDSINFILELMKIKKNKYFYL